VCVCMCVCVRSGLEPCSPAAWTCSSHAPPPVSLPNLSWRQDSRQCLGEVATLTPISRILPGVALGRSLCSLSLSFLTVKETDVHFLPQRILTSPGVQQCSACPLLFPSHELS
jgi:hypothetical protein